VPPIFLVCVDAGLSLTRMRHDSSNNHPLAHLMQSVFGFHDRSRFNIFCYATTPASSPEDRYRQKIEREAQYFRDVSTWSNQQIIEQVLEDRIHILVNLSVFFSREFFWPRFI
jgi:predicted O-linked N-acetylglucosamine transferase (SPINDLY family)